MGLLSDRSLRRLRWAACLLSVALFGYYILASLHWPVVWDGAVMHYMHLLLRHGMRPYSDITDMNLPGCYLTEGWAMDLFGWGDLSWRVYEYVLMAVLALSGAVIGGARHWMAGVYCALFFTLMHGAEGPMMAVERDEVMMVLLVAATACFFVAIRRQQPVLLLLFGFGGGLAVSIKPGALLLDASLILLAYFTVRRQGEPASRYVLWAVAGNVITLGLVIGFLLQYHAFSGLLFIVRNILPSYIHEKNFGRMYLLRHLTPVPLIPLALAALASAFLRRRPWDWERAALWLGMAAGAFAYWAQAKGYLYHRYLFTAFLVLWIGRELSGSQHQNRRSVRILEIVGVCLLFLVAAPFYVRRIYEYPRTIPPPQNLAFALQRDLADLGGPSLQNQVQCLDLVNGCLNALYRLRLVQNKGTAGDLLLFSPRPGPTVDFYRNWFSAREHAHPADVVVLGNEWYFQYAVSFDKINTWPQYANYLRSAYVPVVERHFGQQNSPAYRIYLRKGSEVLALEQAHPLP